MAKPYSYTLYKSSIPTAHLLGTGNERAEKYIDQCLAGLINAIKSVFENKDIDKFRVLVDNKHFLDFYAAHGATLPPAKLSLAVQQLYGTLALNLALKAKVLSLNLLDDKYRIETVFVVDKDGNPTGAKEFTIATPIGKAVLKPRN